MSHKLNVWPGILSEQRKNGFLFLVYVHDNVDFIRKLEATIHVMATSKNDYNNRILSIAHNIKNNPGLVEKYGVKMPLITDKDMAQGTIVEDIEHQTQLQQTRFNQMLQEKYDTINQEQYKTTLKCRRCGSADVTWQQKQTRGADEAMTCFCTCNKCGNRWTMR